MANTGKTRLVTPKTILKSHYFTRGYKDKLKGLGFCKEYDTWFENQQEAYERGRMYAAATDGAVPVKGGAGNKQVTYQAQRVLVELFQQKAMI